MTDQTNRPVDDFIVVQGESEGLPDIWIVNRALDDVGIKAAFPWHLSIIVECKEITAQGLPTQEENAVLAEVGQSFDDNVMTDGNAVTLARITWDGARQYVYRVKDPEVANAYLQSVIESRSELRAFDYQMEEDPGWTLAEPHFRLVRLAPG